MAGLFEVAIEEAVKWGMPAVLTVISGVALHKRQKIRDWHAARKARKAKQTEMIESFQGLRDSMTAIQKQVSSNGGGSLLDAVNRTEASVTEQRSDIASLKASAASIEVIVRSQSDLATEGMFECDAHGHFTFVNLALARMLGVGRNDLLDLRWKNYIEAGSADTFERQVRISLTEHRMLSARVLWTRPDGDVVSTDVTMLPHPEMPPASRWFGKVRLMV